MSLVVCHMPLPVANGKNSGFSSCHRLSFGSVMMALEMSCLKAWHRKQLLVGDQVHPAYGSGRTKPGLGTGEKEHAHSHVTLIWHQASLLFLLVGVCMGRGMHGGGITCSHITPRRPTPPTSLSRLFRITATNTKDIPHSVPTLFLLL